MLSRIGFVLAVLLCACVLPSNAQQLVTDITLPGTPYGIAVNPKTNRIYVNLSTSAGPAVGVIDGNTNSIVATIPTPNGSSFIAVNFVTNRVYDLGCNFAVNPPTCSVTVINGATNAVVATVPVAGTNGIGAQGIAVNPATNEIYVSDDMNYELEVINGNTDATSYIRTQNTEMLGLAIDFSTNEVVGAPSGGVLDVFSPSTHSLTRVPVGEINQDVAVNSFTNRAYVTNNAGTTLGVVNLRNLAVVTNIDVGTAPNWVCADYLSNLVFVTTGDGTVVVVNGRTNAVTGTVNAPSSYIDVNPATRLVYASSTVSQAVHVISE